MFIPRRLDKYLRDTTALSVAELRQACLARRVAVRIPSGERILCPEPHHLVFEDDEVTLDDEPLRPRAAHHYLVFNKPRSLTVTAKDPQGRACLGPLLRQLPDGVFAVGRLDRETSGALLFTDDGDFASAMLRPDRHVSKLYWLWLDEALPGDDPRLGALLAGVTVAPHHPPLRVSQVSIHHRTEHTTELLITLDEGKNRHLRKMCHVLGLRLLGLHRSAIGSLSVQELALGQWRSLTNCEVEALWASTGGRESSVRLKISALGDMAVRARAEAAPLVRLERWLSRFTVSNEPTSVP